MAINLQKGQTINLDKEKYDLSTVTIGLGWDIRKESSFWGNLLGNNTNSHQYDLDAIAFILDSNDKVKNMGTNGKLLGSDVIFFNNLKHPDGSVYHTGDNLTGEGEGDDEQIVVKLNNIKEQYQRILFMVCIYQGITRGQHFGMVENAFIRALDARGQEIARYSLSKDTSYNDKRTMIFAEVYRKDNGWKFRALGEALPGDTFVDVLKKHVYV